MGFNSITISRHGRYIICYIFHTADIHSATYSCKCIGKNLVHRGCIRHVTLILGYDTKSFFLKSCKRSVGLDRMIKHAAYRINLIVLSEEKIHIIKVQQDRIDMNHLHLVHECLKYLVVIQSISSKTKPSDIRRIGNVIGIASLVNNLKQYH